MSAGSVAEYRGQSDTAPAETEAPADVDPNAPPPDEFWAPGEDMAAKKVKLVYKGKEKVIPGNEVIKYAQLGLLATEATQDLARKNDQLTMIEQSFQNPDLFFDRAMEGDDGGDGVMRWIDHLAKRALEHMNKSPDQRRLSQYERAERQRAEQQQRQQTETQTRMVNDNWAKTIQMSGLKEDAIGHAIAAEMREIQGERMSGRKPLYTPEQMAGYAKKRMDEMRGALTVNLSPEQRQGIVRPEDVAARAREQVRQPVIPSASATPPRASNGQFQEGNKARVYDPFA
jgi:hypothetical protein